MTGDSDLIFDEERSDCSDSIGSSFILISSVIEFIFNFTWESSIWVNFGRIVILVQRRVPIVIDWVKIAMIWSSKSCGFVF